MLSLPALLSKVVTSFNHHLDGLSDFNRAVVGLGTLQRTLRWLVKFYCMLSAVENLHKGCFLPFIFLHSLHIRISLAYLRVKLSLNEDTTSSHQHASISGLCCVVRMG